MPKENPLKTTGTAIGAEAAVYSAGNGDPGFKLVDFDQFKNRAFIEWGGKK